MSSNGCNRLLFLSSSCFVGVRARLEEMTLVWGSQPWTDYECVHSQMTVSACLPHCCSPLRRHGSPERPPPATAHLHALIVRSAFLHFQLPPHTPAGRGAPSNQNFRILLALSLLLMGAHCICQHLVSRGHCAVYFWTSPHPIAAVWHAWGEREEQGG